MVVLLGLQALLKGSWSVEAEGGITQQSPSNQGV